MRIGVRKLVVATVWTAAAWAGSAQAQVALRPGESVDLHAVYWVDNCQSVLRKIAGVEVLEGPPSLQLSVREEPVAARRQNCPGKVPGGIVVLTAGPSLEKGQAKVRYRVQYDTEDGRKQSSHSVQVDLVP